MSFVDRPVSQPEKLRESMSERLTREQVERWYKMGTGREIQLARDLLALMDDNDRLREAARVLNDAIKDQADAGHPVSPRVSIAYSALRAALAVPEGETK